MERRELLKMIVAVTGGAMVGVNVAAYEIKDSVKLSQTDYSSEDVKLFNEIAELIIPRTDTPGAKDANVGQMALVLVNDCYTKAERAVFDTGFNAINTLSHARFGSAFPALNHEQKSNFVIELDEEARIYNREHNLFYVSPTPSGNDNPDLPHYFTLIKQLTLFCFFTSKVGSTEVLRFDAVPGKYDGDLNYKKGDRAWAT